MSPIELFNQNIPLIYDIISRTKHRWKKCLEYDDILQECLIGLWLAAKNYNQDKAKFSTFVYSISIRRIFAAIRKSRKSGIIGIKKMIIYQLNSDNINEADSYFNKYRGIEKTTDPLLIMTEDEINKNFIIMAALIYSLCGIKNNDERTGKIMWLKNHKMKTSEVADFMGITRQMVSFISKRGYRRVKNIRTIKKLYEELIIK